MKVEKLILAAILVMLVFDTTVSFQTNRAIAKERTLEADYFLVEKTRLDSLRLNAIFHLNQLQIQSASGAIPDRPHEKQSAGI